MNDATLNRTQIIILLNFFESNNSIIDNYPGKEGLKNVIDCLKSDLFLIDNIYIGNSWVKKNENMKNYV